MLEDDGERWSVYHEDLIRLIQTVVAPNTWDTVGGSGSVEYLASIQGLTVNQTQPVHEAIAELLVMLREASDRLPELARAAKLPLPGKWIEYELKRIRADEKATAESRQAKEKQAAEIAKREAEEATDPRAAKLRAEIQLIEAQTKAASAQAAAAKAESELAAARLKELKGAPADRSGKAAANICPHCKKPLANPNQ